jgi:hypothetical protein
MHAHNVRSNESATSKKNCNKKSPNIQEHARHGVLPRGKNDFPQLKSNCCGLVCLGWIDSGEDGLEDGVQGEEAEDERHCDVRVPVWAIGGVMEGRYVGWKDMRVGEWVGGCGSDWWSDGGKVCGWVDVRVIDGVMEERYVVG